MALYIVLFHLCLYITSQALVYTTRNQTCRFPFVYDGVTYHECTAVHNIKPWCMIVDEDITGQAFAMNKWAYCQDQDSSPQFEYPEGCPIMTVAGTQCRVLFRYGNRDQTTCVWPDNREPFCQDLDGDVHNCLLDQTTQNPPRTCHFPFTYRDGDGQEFTFTSCTMMNSGKRWCATDATLIYYNSGQTNWGYCDIPPDCTPVVVSSPERHP